MSANEDLSQMYTFPLSSLEYAKLNPQGAWLSINPSTAKAIGNTMADYPPYMNSYGRIKTILEKIKEAKTPPIFSYDFLSTTLGAKGGSARAFVGFAKRIGLLSQSGGPTDLYKQFRNPAQSSAAMAAAIRHGYTSLYEKNEYAHKLDKAGLEGVMVEITGLESGNNTLRAIVSSFNALKSLADFDADVEDVVTDPDPVIPVDPRPSNEETKVQLGLNYSINLVLPKTDDIAVFNAIFKSLRENLLRK